MSSPSSINPGHSNLQPTHAAPLFQTTSPSTPQPASILNNARNVQINNGVFTTSVTNTTNTTNISAPASSLALLYESVAPNAILNSGGRADEVRCYPGTREEVVGLIEKSITQQYTGPRMLWLSGPAGAGKSSIMQTVAERCEERGVPHANFFFFRADSTRRDASPFVATIMHQIIKRYPSVGAAVEATLTSDPLIFRMGVQQQFRDLLHEAVTTMCHISPSLPPLALLIDGLDECDSENKIGQRQLLQALDTLLTQNGLYFRVVVASRVEPQISMAFSQLHSEVESLFLDNKYSPEKDIHHFVTAEFDKIKSGHYLASTLSPEWPSKSDIAGIVSKSSGQFIFAATVMRFIAYSSASPIVSLQKVQGIVPPNKNSPFAQLDAVYAYILRQVDDLEAVKTLLAIRLVDQTFNLIIPDIMTAYQPRFSRAVFHSCLSELAPLVSSDSHGLEFFHASFTDFLHDHTRSREYHIDLETFCAGAIPIWWRKQSSSLSIAETSCIPSSSFVAASSAIHKVKRPTPEITAALMECSPMVSHIQSSSKIIRGMISRLHKIYAPQSRQAFINIMHRWTSRNPELAELFPQDLLQHAARGNNSQILSSTAKMHPPPFNRKIRPSPHQMHLSTSQTGPSASAIPPSTPQARPINRQPHPPIALALPSTSQPHLPSFQASSSAAKNRPNVIQKTKQEASKTGVPSGKGKRL